MRGARNGTIDAVKKPNRRRARKEEWPCAMCGEPFMKCRPREVWAQCHLYNDYSVSCTMTTVSFVQ